MTTIALPQSPPAQMSGEFLRVIIGSTIHGLSVEGTDDLDLMGVRIESPEEAIVLDGAPFQQLVWRTQPEGEPSGVGDIDLTVYSLRKYLHLAAKGNPTVLNLLFVAPESRHIDEELAHGLRAMTPLIVSREAAARYAGYLRSQRERLVGERGQKRTGYTRRLKYLSEGGWDTKYAMHMIRLGLQGVELLTTGKITLPMPEPYRTEVFNIRMGNVEVEGVVERAIALEAQLGDLSQTADLPAHPDRDTLSRWLVRTYRQAWA